MEMVVMARKMVDCRKVPSEINCTLTIAGNEEELLDAAVIHAVTRHGDEDTPELRQMIISSMQDVEPALT
jgi:predicted small metal-binding protein